MLARLGSFTGRAYSSSSFTSLHHLLCTTPQVRSVLLFSTISQNGPRRGDRQPRVSGGVNSPSRIRSRAFHYLFSRLATTHKMASPTQRRQHNTSSRKKETGEEKDMDHNNNHDHDHQGHPDSDHNHDTQSHSHSHSHSFFSLSHNHSHGEDGHSHGADAERIVATLKGEGDRGSRITLIGLASNVGLTITKGAAGWYMNSASLLADAGHSLSDLVGDFVTLFCWKLSRRPPSETYPYGYGKFEVLGTSTVSILLIAGAVGIGMHSWSLLADSLSSIVTTIPEGPLHDLLVNVTQVAHSVPTLSAEHGHAHAHSHSLDPNAAWFAALSVIAKEWLYRATKRVADDERSPVLYANAVHHRSDAYSSFVALVAILGSWWFPHLPLDPIGGLLVSVLIFQQSWGILVTAFRQLTDAGVSERTKRVLTRALRPLLPDESTPHVPTLSQRTHHTESLFGVREVRAMRTGALMFVDLVAEVPKGLTIEHASDLEQKITETLKGARKEISEVRIRFHPVDRKTVT